MSMLNGALIGGANSAARRETVVHPTGEDQSYRIANSEVSDFDRANDQVLDVLESEGFNDAMMVGSAGIATSTAVVSTLAAGGCAGAAVASGAAALGVFGLVAGAGIVGGKLGMMVGDALFDAVGDDLMTSLGYSRVTTEGDAPACMGHAIAHQMKNIGLLGALVGAVAAIAIGALAVSGVGLLVLGAVALAGGFVAGAIGAFASKAGQYGTNKGVIASGSMNVLFEGKPVARTLDIIICSDHPNPPPVIAEGAKTVFVNGRNLARIGHRTSCDANINEGCKTIVTTLETDQVVEVASSISNGLRWANVIVNFLPLPRGRGKSKPNRSYNQLRNKISKLLKLGEPVDPTTGDYLQEWPLLNIPGTIPLDLTIYYRSTNPVSGLFGRHWIDAWSQRLTLHPESVNYLNDEGIDIEYHTPDNAVYSRHERHKELILFGERNGCLRLWQRSQRLIYTFDYRPSEQTRLLSGIDDLHGNHIRFYYDDQHHLTRIEHSDGYHLLVYTEQGRIHRVTQANGAPLLQCQYEEAFLVQRNSYQHGTLYHEYNPQGWMTRWYDTDQTDASIMYDNQGRVLGTQTRSGHFSDRFEYDDEQQLTRYHDAEGGITQVYYDDHCQVRCFIDPLGQATHYEYDISGECSRITHSDGEQESFVHNDQGELIQHSNRQQQTTDYTYNGLGQCTSITQFEQTTTHFYDEQGKLTATEHPHGKRSTYRYGERGLLYRTCLFDGRQIHYHYDQYLRLCAVQEDKNHTRLQLDLLGRLLEVEDAEGGITRYEYGDQHPGPRTITHPDDTQEHFTYTSEHLLQQAQDRQGRQTQYHYGPFDKMTAIVHPDQSQIQFHYDRLNRMTAVTNAQGSTWTYQYDVAGQVTQETDYSGVTMHYRYNTVGLCTHKLTHRNEHHYHYNPELQLEKTTIHQRQNDGTLTPVASTHYAYNDQGQMTEARNDQSKVTFEYNDLGQLTQECINGRAIDYQYDPDTLRLTQLAWDQQAIDYHYAHNGQVSTITAKGHQSLYFEYDHLGRETLRQQGQFAHITQYNRAGLIKAQAAGQWNQYLQDQYAHMQEWKRSVWDPNPLQGNRLTRHYHYDKAMNPVKILESSGTSEYQYNHNDQITQARFTHNPRPQAMPSSPQRGEYSGGKAITERFEYDNNRQLSLASEQQDNNEYDRQYWQIEQTKGKIQRRGQDSYLYDQYGRLKEKYVHRPGFRPQTWRYQWNEQDQLVSLQTPKGERWHYQYDAFGRRIRKFQAIKGQAEHLAFGQANAQQATTPSIIGEEFLWAGNQLIEAAPITADGSVAYDQATQWAYADSGFTPCLQLKCKPAVNDSQAPAANDAQNQDDQPNTDLYHIITDHLGTPRELLDDQGNIAWQRRHSTWGNTRLLASPYTKAANDDINCPLVFQGQYIDEESGLHYNRFRYYDPDTAQYCSPDPLKLGGGFYPQSYVHNPNGWIDPFGLAGYVSFIGGALHPDTVTPTNPGGVYKIKATGDYHADKVELYGQARLKESFSADYVAHHVDYDPKTNEMTMQLVRKKDHQINHIGGVKDYQDIHGQGYGKSVVKKTKC